MDAAELLTMLRINGDEAARLGREHAAHGGQDDDVNFQLGRQAAFLTVANWVRQAERDASVLANARRAWAADRAMVADMEDEGLL
jgi:hypothetical protein